MGSHEEAKRIRDEDFDELMAACDIAKEAVRKDNRIPKATTESTDGDLDPFDKISEVHASTTSPPDRSNENPRVRDKLPMTRSRMNPTEADPVLSDEIPDAPAVASEVTLRTSPPVQSAKGNPRPLERLSASTGTTFPVEEHLFPRDRIVEAPPVVPRTVPRSVSPAERIEKISHSSQNPEAPQNPQNPHALDKLDSSVESDPLTVVERDDNGFVYYKCRFCGLTFNYMNTLRAHERVHNVSQPYVCGKCGVSFEFACQLEYHTQQHGDIKGYKCECGRTFFSYTEMLYHKHPEDLEKEKADKELHGSPILVHPSTSRVALLQDMPTPAYMEEGFEPKHPLKVYSDVRSKPYICEYCSKSYADSRQLAYHMYSHRGERQFNPRSSRYLIGRTGVGYTDRSSYFLFPRTSGYVPPLY